MGADYKPSKEPPLLGGVATNLANNGTREYFPVCGVFASTGLAIGVELIAQYAGIIDRMTSWVNAVPGGAASRTMTLYVNGAPTALTVTFGAASQFEVDDVNVVAVQRGDRIVWSSDGGVGVPAFAICKTSCRYRRV